MIATGLHRNTGGTMKRISLLLAFLAIFTAVPAAAEPQQKMLTYEEAMEQNRKSLKLVKEGLPLVLPTWALPFYFTMIKQPDDPKQKKK
jgi:hypothetical protein